MATVMQNNENSIFEEIPFNKASDLVNDIRLTNPRWTSEVEANSKWLFRGQWNSAWQLYPKAWRPSKFIHDTSDYLHTMWGRENLRSLVENFWQKQYIPLSERSELHFQRTRNILLQAATELLLTRNFLNAAEMLGFAVPNSRELPIPTSLDFASSYLASLHSNTIAVNHEDNLIWSDEVFAFAQHYGIPSRGLDWTKNPLAAAFFATEKPEKEDTMPQYIAIYAILPEHLLVSPLQPYGGRRKNNSYIRHQNGFFVRMLGADVFYLEHGRWPDLIELYSSISVQHNGILRQPKKLILPTTQVEDLLRLLSIERINRASLMPSLENVAKSVEEYLKIVNRLPLSEIISSITLGNI